MHTFYKASDRPGSPQRQTDSPIEIALEGSVIWVSLLFGSKVIDFLCVQKVTSPAKYNDLSVKVTSPAKYKIRSTIVMKSAGRRPCLGGPRESSTAACLEIWIHFRLLPRHSNHTRYRMLARVLAWGNSTKYARRERRVEVSFQGGIGLEGGPGVPRHSGIEGLSRWLGSAMLSISGPQIM